MINNLIGDTYWDEGETIIRSFAKETGFESFHFNGTWTDASFSATFLDFFLVYEQGKILDSYFGRRNRGIDKVLDRQGNSKISLEKIIEFLPQAIHLHKKTTVCSIIDHKFYEFTSFSHAGIWLQGRYRDRGNITTEQDPEYATLSAENDFNVLYEKYIESIHVMAKNSPLYKEIQSKKK